MDLLASGRDADVFVLDDGLVLRRYRDGRSAAAEAATIRAVSDAGFPTPRVHRVDGHEMVLDRIDGPDLLTAVLTGLVDADAAARVLADLHTRLHALPWPGGTLLHLDLHPLNVLWGADGPVVVDWSNARVGEPDLDVAMTALILAQVAVAPQAFAAESPVEPARLDDLVRSYLGTFAAAVPPSYTDRLDEAVARRRLDPNVGPAELAALDDAARLARDVVGRCPN
ncbi:phosphotransferase [Myceligenerans halotolerans]